MQPIEAGETLRGRKITTDDAPHHVDVHVGQRIRLLRKTRGLRQTDLADAIGVSYQQIQKYETAGSRVSASVMHELANALEVPITELYRGLDAADQADAAAEVGRRLILDPRGRELGLAFLALESEAMRDQVLSLVHTLLAAERAMRPQRRCRTVPTA